MTIPDAAIQSGIVAALGFAFRYLKGRADECEKDRAGLHQKLTTTLTYLAELCGKMGIDFDPEKTPEPGEGSHKAFQVFPEDGETHGGQRIIKTNQLYLATAVAAVALQSCTVIHGDSTKGTYTLATVGGDVKEYSQSATAVTAGALDNSTSFRDATKTVRWGLVAAATQSIAGDALGAWKGVTAAKESTKAAGIKSAAAVEQSKIAADVTKATFEPATTTITP